MSRISKQIRAYVDDPESTGGLYYGEWGILRSDQRRLIRKLCDECDAFERDADHIAEQHEALLREKDAKISALQYQADFWDKHAKVLDETISIQQKEIAEKDAEIERLTKERDDARSDCANAEQLHYECVQEVERLKSDFEQAQCSVELLGAELGKLGLALSQVEQIARAEAITEFLERAYAKARDLGDIKPYVTLEDLEEISKKLQEDLL